MIEMNCPHCGQKMSIDDKFAGQHGKCKTCQKKITVPGGSPIAPIPPVFDIPDNVPPRQSMGATGKNMGKKVKETLAICKACGHQWHYLHSDRTTDIAHDCQFCPCCLPFQAKPKVSTSKCPKCSSSAIERKKIVHIV